MTGLPALASVAIAALAAVAGTVSAAAASPAPSPATAQSRTLIFTVHFSPFEVLHLNPKPDPKTGFGFGDELTFHDLRFSHGQQAGDEGGSCVVVDGAQALANCTEVVRLQQGTITAQFLNGPPPSKHLAVTGGTGIYRDAAGGSHPGGVRTHNRQADTPPARHLTPAGQARPTPLVRPRDQNPCSARHARSCQTTGTDARSAARRAFSHQDSLHHLL